MARLRHVKSVGPRDGSTVRIVRKDNGTVVRFIRSTDGTTVRQAAVGPADAAAARLKLVTSRELGKPVPDWVEAVAEADTDVLT